MDKLWTFSHDQIYLGAAGVAAQLLKDGADVSVIDCAVDCRSVGRLKKRLALLQPDIAAVPVIYGTIPNAYKIAKAVKETTRALVVFGGLPATFSAERVLAECPETDICVLNEGEAVMSALAAGKPPAEVAGVAFRRDGRTVCNPPAPLLQDLDSLAFPARHLFPQKKYHGFSLHAAILQHSTNMETKRGCPFACEFCLQAPKEGVRYRLRSPARVIEEMLQIKRDFPFIGRIMLVDNDFMAPYDHGMAILDGILKNGLQEHFEFMAATRVQSFLKGGDELISKFAAANLCMVYFGLESLNKKNRGRLNKIKQEYDVTELFERMRKKGVNSIGSYIFGFENETEEDMLETVNASLKDFPSLVKYNILTPYPGTRSYEDYAAKGRLRPEVPLGDYDNAHQTMVHDVDCRGFFRSAYRKFYFRPYLIGKIEWLSLFKRKKGVRLVTFAHHVLKRELFGFMRDAYRFVKFRVFGSGDFVG